MTETAVSPLDQLRPRYDVVVIGARAAGAATAMLLARRGLRVLAVDRGAYGSDTMSTHALMRPAVHQLARWGLLERLEEAGTPRVERSVFHYDDERVEIAVKSKGAVPALFAPRRTVLDRMLVDAAVEAGATVLHRVRLSDVLRGSDGRVEGAIVKDMDGGAAAVTADVVVGADGIRSALANIVRAPLRRRGLHATATIYGYWSGLSVRDYHWYWTRGAAAGAIPTNGGLVLLFASVGGRSFANEFRADVPRLYMQTLERAAPGMAMKLDGARLAGPLYTFPGHPGFLRRPWGPGWALVGDAAYFKDPITSHGISDALRDAELLANALTSGEDNALAAYEAQRDSLSLRYFDLTDRIASFAWDTAELKALHQALSEEMKREVAALSGWDRPSGLALAS